MLFLMVNNVKKNQVTYRTLSLFKGLVICSLLSLLVTLPAEADSKAELVSTQPLISVVVAPVKLQTLDFHSTFVGKVEARKRVELRARVQGYLKTRNFEPGTTVEKGQVLFEIQAERYQGQVAQSQAKVAADQANLADARAKLKRMKRLKAKKAVSQQDYDVAIAVELGAKAAVKASQAQLMQAKLDLSYTKVKAPFTGLISQPTVDVGNLVGGDTTVLATLVDISAVDVTFGVTDTDYLSFFKEQAARTQKSKPEIQSTFSLVLPDGSLYRFPGVFRSISNEVNPQTATLAITVRFPNANHLLRPGLYVKVNAGRSESDSVLMVPQSAVQMTQAGYFVLVVDENNKVEKRAVELGERSGMDWVVLSGLKAGESAIVQGIQKVKPGIQVNPVLAVVPEV